jgi:hypothetical protein
VNDLAYLVGVGIIVYIPVVFVLVCWAIDRRKH